MAEFEDEVDEQDGGAGGVRIVIEPILFNREMLARKLGVSTKTIDCMRRAGCPSITVPGRKRPLYDAAAVKAWLIERAKRDESMPHPDAVLSLKEASRRASAMGL